MPMLATRSYRCMDPVANRFGGPAVVSELPRTLHRHMMCTEKTLGWRELELS